MNSYTDTEFTDTLLETISSELTKHNVKFNVSVNSNGFYVYNITFPFKDSFQIGNASIVYKLKTINFDFFIECFLDFILNKSYVYNEIMNRPTNLHITIVPHSLFLEENNISEFKDTFISVYGQSIYDNAKTINVLTHKFGMVKLK